MILCLMEAGTGVSTPVAVGGMTLLGLIGLMNMLYKGKGEKDEGVAAAINKLDGTVAGLSVQVGIIQAGQGALNSRVEQDRQLAQERYEKAERRIETLDRMVRGSEDVRGVINESFAVSTELNSIKEMIASRLGRMEQELAALRRDGNGHEKHHD